MPTYPLTRLLPAPFLCSDPGSFAENTLLSRLPDIARRVIAENQFPKQRNQNIFDLITEIPKGIIRELIDPQAPDIDLWKGYLASWTGKSWRQLSFLACEHFFYRKILAATGYFQPGETCGIDPYLYQKKLGLTVSRHAVQVLATRLETWRKNDFPPIEALQEAIENNLWGNRADLSLWPADAAGTLSNAQLHQAEDFLFSNQISEVVAAILAPQPHHSPCRVDFLIDNAGFELICDLALADLMLGRGWVDQVCFHLKAHPTFVSDALSSDAVMTIEFLKTDEKTASFGTRLGDALRAGKLILAENYFWNSPLAAWEMPENVRATLTKATLVFSKGDANYRRLVGDLRWPHTIPFAQVTNYFPTRLAALRTSKSEVIVGLRDGQTEELSLKEADWQTSGRWGLIQYKA